MDTQTIKRLQKNPHYALSREQEEMLDDQEKVLSLGKIETHSTNFSKHPSGPRTEYYNKKTHKKYEKK